MKPLSTPPYIDLVIDKAIIEKSLVRSSSHCMLAEGLRHAKPQFRRISVDLQTIRATDPEKGLRYIWFTPRVAQKALVDYDQGIMPRPFKFKHRDGQTVAATNRSPEVMAKRRVYQEKYHEERKKKMLRFREGKHNTPSILGGKSPPRLPGAMQAFGLRALKY